MIYIDNIRKSKKTLQKLYPNALYVDVTSKAKTGLIKLSPFYPHGGIPIPYSNNETAQSVEGIWQGLKVFENKGVDIGMFENVTMKNIKRTVRKYGIPKGHRKGIYGSENLDYINARIYIYLPSYLWILENKVKYIIDRLRKVKDTQDIVLLDYATNCDVLDPRKPLSHAFLVKQYVEGKFPSSQELQERLREIKLLDENPYIFKKKQVKNPVLVLDENIISDILNIIKKTPMSSKEIVDKLNLSLNTHQLTSVLKKSKEIISIAGVPISFIAK